MPSELLLDTGALSAGRRVLVAPQPGQDERPRRSAAAADSAARACSCHAASLECSSPRAGANWSYFVRKVSCIPHSHSEIGCSSARLSGRTSQPHKRGAVPHPQRKTSRWIAPPPSSLHRHQADAASRHLYCASILLSKRPKFQPSLLTPLPYWTLTRSPVPRL